MYRAFGSKKDVSAKITFNGTLNTPFSHGLAWWVERSLMMFAIPIAIAKALQSSQRSRWQLSQQLERLTSAGSMQ